jgi:drug/metabolite transporter (DMT)-like permease
MNTVPLQSKTVESWFAIFAVVVMTTVGDVLIASAMRRIQFPSGSQLRASLFVRPRAVLGEYRFILGLIFMALSFFSLLVALNRADLSLVGPATGSLTFLSNAIAARVVLKENVDRRRWLAAVFVCIGVILVGI